MIEHDAEREVVCCRYCGEVLNQPRELARARKGRLICQDCWLDGMDLDF